MTNYEKIKSMSEEELANFLVRYTEAPWMDWWDKNYCSKCETVRLTQEESQKYLGIKPFREIIEAGYCEVHDRCRYFVELDHCVTNKEIIELWLKKGYNNE